MIIDITKSNQEVEEEVEEQSKSDIEDYIIVNIK